MIAYKKIVGLKKIMEERISHIEEWLQMID